MNSLTRYWTTDDGLVPIPAEHLQRMIEHGIGWYRASDVDPLLTALEAREQEIHTVRPTGIVHDLKTWPDYFAGILTGAKNFEIRKDDRGFEIGDELLLREWDPNTKVYSGRCARRQIKYIASHFLPDGLRVLGLEEIARDAEFIKAVEVSHELNERIVALTARAEAAEADLAEYSIAFGRIDDHVASLKRGFD